MTQGTKEWAEKNINFQTGCSNGCTYCYAAEMAYRFKRIHSFDEWHDPKYIQLRVGEVNKHRQHTDLQYMLPSSHDITPINLQAAIQIINCLLKADNKVLIVSKPNETCMKRLLQCIPYTVKTASNLEFRFTITTIDDEIRKWFEPYAPSIQERLEAANHVRQYYKLSFSIEPFLDSDPLELASDLQENFEVGWEDIWIGPMNHRPILYAISPQLAQYKQYLETIYDPVNLQKIYCKAGQKQYLKFNLNFKDGFYFQMNRGLKHGFSR